MLKLIAIAGVMSASLLVPGAALGQNEPTSNKLGTPECLKLASELNDKAKAILIRVQGAVKIPQGQRTDPAWEPFYQSVRVFNAKCLGIQPPGQDSAQPQQTTN